MFSADISISLCDIGSSPPPHCGGLLLVRGSRSSAAVGEQREVRGIIR